MSKSISDEAGAVRAAEQEWYFSSAPAPHKMMSFPAALAPAPHYCFQQILRLKFVIVRLKFVMGLSKKFQLNFLVYLLIKCLQFLPTLLTAFTVK
jgi:hypothetical protein